MDGNTLYHHTALAGTLGDLPESLLSPSNSNLTNYRNATPVFTAASNGALDRYPPHLITRASATTWTSSGSSALHAAARHGQLHLFPPHQRGDLSPLCILAEQGNLASLPRQILESPILAEGRKPAVFHALIKGNLDQLLGIPLHENVQRWVGKGWWEKNQEALARRKRDLEVADATFESGLTLG